MNETSPKRKAAAYHRLKRGLAGAELALTILYLAALLAGWNRDLEAWSAALFTGPVGRATAFFVLATLGLEIMTLPLAFWSGFHAEKSFGLSNQTLGAWLLDLLKAQIVGLVLGLVAVQTLYLLIRLAESAWWLAAGCVFALFFVLLANLTPVIILPWFFTFKRLPEGDLSRRLTALCQKAGVGALPVHEWGLAAKTKRANAAVVGWGATRRVVLSDSLLTGFTGSEVEAVLAHELGHHRLGHIWTLLGIQIGLTFLAFLLADLLYRGFGPLLGLHYLDDLTGLPLFALIFLLLGLLSRPLTNWVSRRLESQADHFALELTGLAGSFISALERLAVLNLAEMEPSPMVEFLFHSHPSPARRIRAAKEFRRRQGTDAFH